ncbi:hypothetical protein JOC77_002202 [Peribacillus deserti]|uniref:Uncharacterized protein n=1 Tax=Peribacillus deserti TaxID=673318 RepID=A0ABS2QKG6_9BACI|nr:hypothetical protein [Peribacillus deserti]
MTSIPAFSVYSILPLGGQGCIKYLQIKYYEKQLVFFEIQLILSEKQLIFSEKQLINFR